LSLISQTSYYFQRISSDSNSFESGFSVFPISDTSNFVAFTSYKFSDNFWKLHIINQSNSSNVIFNHIIVGNDSSNPALGRTYFNDSLAICALGIDSDNPNYNRNPGLVAVDLKTFGLKFYKKVEIDSFNFYSDVVITPKKMVAVGFDKSADQKGEMLFSRLSNSGSAVEHSNLGTLELDNATSLLPTIDGGFFILGTSRGYGSEPGFYNQALLIKTDSLGNELWRTTWGGYFNDCANNLAATPDGGVIACGCISAEPPESDGYTFGYIRKMNSLGELVWDFTFPDKSLNEGSRTSSYAVCRVLENGNIIAVGTGYAWASDSITDRIVPRAIILDKNGNVLMERAYTSLVGGYSSAEFQDIQPTADGGFIAGGTYYPSQGDTGNQDAFIVKLDERGCEFAECQPPLAVEELSDEVGFELKVWPNPAQDILNIEASSTIKEVHIFDQMGREVFSTPLELTKSRTTEQLSVSSFKTGLYFLVVKTAKGVETKKVIIE
jgi:hypothetical protein